MSEPSPQQPRQRSWPFLEREMRNWYPSSEWKKSTGKPLEPPDRIAWLRLPTWPSLSGIQVWVGVRVRMLRKKTKV
jgi:hypothetical protein